MAILAVRVLCVDDSGSLPEQVQQLLEASDPGRFQVAAVPTGDEALVVLAGEIYDIVLVSYQLTGESAFDVLATLRRVNFTGPVFLVTERRAERVVAESMQMGFAGFLSESDLRPTVLARILLTVFQRYLVQHAARAAITSMLDGALYVVLSVALKGLPVDNGAAFVWDPDTFRFVLSVQVGMDDAMLAKFEAQRLEPDDVPQLMRAIGELQPLAVEDAQADPALLGTLAGLGNGAVVIAPFFHITQLLGILYLGRGVPYRFHAEDLLFLSNLLRQTSAAVANAVFIQELHEADAAKTMMLRMASHDLRSPLTQAYTYLELFRRTMGPLGLEQAELLTGLGKSLKRIEAMIGDVLDVEHAVAGGRWDPVNVATLVADIYAEKAPLAAVRQQKLVIELDGALPGALGDGVQLRQAVANLVDNAIKYTPPGGWIWVRARPLADQILIEVQDTGYGIALEDQSRIFEHFYRSSRDNVREVEGVGLGLSLVKAVVERHGGRVWVESEVGKGSAFRLMVPART